MRADKIVSEAGRCLIQRGVDYDSKGGERSMGHAVQIFTSITGVALTEEQGWLLMMAVKMARMMQGKPKPDNYIDLSAYAALLGETATNGGNGNDVAG